jgi:hypothetical protein
MLTTSKYPTTVKENLLAQLLKVRLFAHLPKPYLPNTSANKTRFGVVSTSLTPIDAKQITSYDSRTIEEKGPGLLLKSRSRA